MSEDLDITLVEAVSDTEVLVVPAPEEAQPVVVEAAEAPTVVIAGNTPAADGISAYQVAVNNGFVGTEAQWLASLKGDPGDDGADGSIWYQGAGVPADSTGVDGDYYFRTATADIYRRSSGTWGSAVANIKGATGASGPAGVDGADGTDGAAGADGHSPTLTWQSDQIAIDGVVTGPHLTGPAGADGADGADGAAGPNTVSTSTDTNITGILAGNGSKVKQAAAEDFPTLNQNTTGTAAGLSDQYIDWNETSGGKSIANKPTIPVKASGAEITTGTEDTKFATAKALSDAGIILANIASGWFAAGETWTYASASSPSFTFTVSGDVTTKYSPGMRLKLTQATGGTKYFIVTLVSYSAPNTTITVYGGTDYTLNNEAISSPYFSAHKAPAGFPLSPTKWLISVGDTTDRYKTNPTQGTWYGGANGWTSGANITITVPPGAWDLGYSVLLYGQESSTASITVAATLSSSDSSESNTDLTTALNFTLSGVTHSNLVPYLTVSRSKQIVVASATTYYLLGKSIQSASEDVRFRNSAGAFNVTAVCAYL